MGGHQYVVAGHYFKLTLLTPSWPARGGGRPATFKPKNQPAIFLVPGTLQLCSPFPQKISQSGGYFVGESLPPFPPLLHPPFGPYNQLPLFILGARKFVLQASRSISPSILLIIQKNLKSYTLFSSSPPSSTTTTSFPATRRASQRLKELQIGPRSNKSFGLQG